MHAACKSKKYIIIIIYLVKQLSYMPHYHSQSAVIHLLFQKRYIFSKLYE